MLHRRQATSADSAQIIAHIDRVYREYGDRIFLQDADADLLDIELNYPKESSEFSLFEEEDRLVGTLAVCKLEANEATFRRFYLLSERRGSGLGTEMLNWGLSQVQAFGCQRIVFWSDTRFTRAHRFFEKNHFKKGEIRHKNDGYMPYSEYRFERVL